MRDVSDHPDRCYMSEIERELGVHRSTVRTWESWKSFPEALAFKRDEINWRYWTREQLALAREWRASSQQRRTNHRSA